MFRSLCPFQVLAADRNTYLICLLTFSFHVASQVTVLSCCTPFHLPGMLGIGTGASFDRFRVMSSGRSRCLSVPFLGCSPRPRNKPGGSARKLPHFSCRPSIVAKIYGFSSASRSALILIVSRSRVDLGRHLRLLLLRGQRLLLFPLRLKVLEHWLEVAFAKVLHLGAFFLVELAISG